MVDPVEYLKKNPCNRRCLGMSIQSNPFWGRSNNSNLLAGTIPLIYHLYIYIYCQLGDYLVGGFNPFEKYARQIGSFPQIGTNIKHIWNHQPGGYGDVHSKVVSTHRTGTHPFGTHLYQQAISRDSFHIVVYGDCLGCAISGCVVSFLDPWNIRIIIKKYKDPY